MQENRLSIRAVVCHDNELLTALTYPIDRYSGLELDHGIGVGSAEWWTGWGEGDHEIDQVKYDDIRLTAEAVRNILCHGLHDKWTDETHYDWQRDTDETYTWLYLDDHIVVGVSCEQLMKGAAVV